MCTQQQLIWLSGTWDGHRLKDPVFWQHHGTRVDCQRWLQGRLPADQNRDRRPFQWIQQVGKKTKCPCFGDNGDVVDRIYLALLFSTLEQTHCALVTCDSKGVTVGWSWRGRLHADCIVDISFVMGTMAAVLAALFAALISSVVQEIGFTHCFDGHFSTYLADSHDLERKGKKPTETGFETQHVKNLWIDYIYTTECHIGLDLMISHLMAVCTKVKLSMTNSWWWTADDALPCYPCLQLGTQTLKVFE